MTPSLLAVREISPFCQCRPSQASKLDLFVKAANSFELTFLLKFHCRCLKSHQYSSDLFYCRQLVKCITIHDQINQLWAHQVCKHYQNMARTLVFRIVFGIHYNFFVFSPIELKICRSNEFSFSQGKMYVPKKSSASLRFCATECIRCRSVQSCLPVQRQQ